MMCCLDPLHLLLQQSTESFFVHAKQDNVNFTLVLLKSWAMGCFTFLFAIFCVVGLCRATLYQGLIGSPTRKARRCLQSWTASLSRGGCTRHGFEKQRRISEQKIHDRGYGHGVHDRVVETDNSHHILYTNIYAPYFGDRYFCSVQASL